MGFFFGRGRGIIKPSDQNAFSVKCWRLLRRRHSSASGAIYFEKDIAVQQYTFSPWKAAPWWSGCPKLTFFPVVVFYKAGSREKEKNGYSFPSTFSASVLIHIFSSLALPHVLIIPKWLCWSFLSRQFLGHVPHQRMDMIQPLPPATLR